MAGQFQFVNVSNPIKPSPAGSRKSTHSHVMRQVHARKRHLQTERFQNAKQIMRIYGPILLWPPPQVLANSKDPFSSLPRPLLSEEYFLLDHYIQVVLPSSIGHCGLFNQPGDHKAQMLREWVGLAITDYALMAAGVLLSTCRYILLQRPDDPVFTCMVLQYKRTCLRTLREELSSMSHPIKTTTVAKALALAIDEVRNPWRLGVVVSGEYGIARKHLQGVLAMIQFSGGPKSIGLTGLLKRMYDRFLISLELTDTQVDTA
ncbi:hypothetical protein GGS20DRAFT_483914 [Poronia punctata]|nr:hypothetical protein GGS20DRAFT_483914 [Poronia punctata]